MKLGEIYVTRPFLPPLEEFVPYLEQIWENGQVTNCGPFHQEFEEAVGAYLGVENVALFTNGTIALVTALQSMRITGEVITTPFSFVATSNSLLWNGIKPIFVDIDPDTLNIDPRKVEAAITPHTTAIMPVHCYGRPCNTRALQKIADTYNLKIIYDAAHAFGSRDEGGSILRHGDLSVLSFHATKVFNTFEGGAIICPDAKTKIRIDQLKNFGIVSEVNVVAPGINGKMSEFNAALGMLQLKYMNRVMDGRKHVHDTYISLLANVPGIRCLNPKNEPGFNYSYFPILFGDDYPLSRDQLYQYLKNQGIHPRRYFYPLISDFPMYRGLPSANVVNLPVANNAARRVICLPIYPDLELSILERICNFIANPMLQPVNL